MGTWGLYRLSGETISQRWTRELQEIQIENAANDQTQKELRIEKRLDRLTEEEWIQKQAVEQDALRDESPPLLLKAVVRVKELFGPTNIDLSPEEKETKNVNMNNINEHEMKKVSTGDVR